MENIFFLILVAVVGLLRWLSQAAENKRNTDTTKRRSAPSSAAPTRNAPMTEEERVRKFFEALGVPTTTAPPPKVQPRPAAPQPSSAERKIRPIDPFPVPRGRVVEPSRPVVSTPPPLPAVTRRSVPTAPARPAVTATEIQAATSATAGEFEIDDFAGASVRPDVDSDGLLSRVTTVRGLREAMILREILGPPRSMQPIAHTTAG